MRWSSRFLLRIGVCRGLASFEGGAEPVKARLPLAAIPRPPGLELVERFLAQRVEALLSVRAHLHDPRLGQDAQVPRNAGLVDVHALDDVADGALPRLHRLDDAKTGRVRKGVE